MLQSGAFCVALLVCELVSLLSYRIDIPNFSFLTLGFAFSIIRFIINATAPWSRLLVRISASQKISDLPPYVLLFMFT